MRLQRRAQTRRRAGRGEVSQANQQSEETESQSDLQLPFAVFEIVKNKVAYGNSEQRESRALSTEILRNAKISKTIGGI